MGDECDHDMNEKTQNVFRFVYSEAVAKALKRVYRCGTVDTPPGTPSKKDLDADIFKLPEIYEDLVHDGIDPMSSKHGLLGGSVELSNNLMETPPDNENSFKLPVLHKNKSTASFAKMHKKNESSVNKVKLPIIR